MKKKIISLCLVLALALTAIGGATLAYFTDTDEAENVFTLGSVKIKLHEGAYKDVQKNGAPINSDKEVDLTKANPNNHKNDEAGKFGYDYLDETYQSWLADQTLMPGGQGFNRIQKRIFVENTGKYDAYVRVIVGVPTELDNVGNASQNILHFNQVTGDVNNKLGNWIEGGKYAFTQDGYNYYIYYYTDIVKAGDATNAEALSYFWLDGKVDFDGTNYFYMNGEQKVTLSSVKSVTDKESNVTSMQIEIPVYAEAIQAAGFDAYTDAWEAYGDPAIKTASATDITKPQPPTP